MGDIQREAISRGYETLSFVGRRKLFSDIPAEKFGNAFSFWLHVILTTIFDRQGYGSYFSTRKLIKRLRSENPDIIHLHNLHGYYLNLPLLFDYLKNEYHGKIVWTFHDCWPFTGHCPYFTVAQCEKWKTECSRCVNKKKYPISLFCDASKRNYYDKKLLFSNFTDLTIVTPSEWLKRLVEQSFFKSYPVRVIPNGIDLDVYYYARCNKVEQKYQIPDDKKIILGVASIWEKRKGIDDFFELADHIGEEYRIVLVGVSKVQKKMMKPNMIGIERTENVKELTALYSRADVFMNPSREETFSMVTVEAFACGTPVIVLDTSAVKELVTQDNGIVLEQYTTSDYLAAIRKIENKGVDRQQVAQTAQCYDYRVTNSKIMELYENER